jgi:hypothetical protein
MFPTTAQQLLGYHHNKQIMSMLYKEGERMSNLGCGNIHEIIMVVFWDRMVAKMTTISVSGVFRKCLYRQLDEGFRILECENETGVVLNSKNEWFTPRIVETVFRQQ